MKWHRRGTNYWQAKRNVTLKKEGFTPNERRELKKMTFSNSKWFRRARAQRARELRDMKTVARDRGLTRAEFLKEWYDFIREKYVDNRWITAGGRLDPWAMFRALRAQAIKRGEWVDTPPKPGSHRRSIRKMDGGFVRIDKGSIKEQRARYHEKQLARKGR